jgi:multidrug efflux pump subunit AcrA (membrane-fusion protein)
LTLTIVAGLILAIPLAAHAFGPAKNPNAITTTVDIFNPASLAGKQLKPGTYVITADDSKVTLVLNGKVVAEAPAQGKDRAGRAQNSTVEAIEGKIKEIHFAGKTRYLEITN